MKIELKFKKEYLDLLKEGIKTSTIRKHSDLKKNDTFYFIDYEVNNDLRSLIKNYDFRVTDVERIRFDEINDEIAKSEGFLHKNLLKRELKMIYSNLEDSDLLYLIKFKRI